MENTPNYLYHYTTVESLALILKNRSIRFKSLDQMDDLQECMAADLKKAGQFIFVSSWTKLSEENIAMWNMYATLNAGVRIKLRANPFKSHPVKPELYGCVIKSENYEGEPCLIPLEFMVEKNFLSRSAIHGNILKKVTYTQNTNKLYPKIFEPNDSIGRLNLNKLGLHKNKGWTFQKEWRYIFEIIPVKDMPIKKDDIKNTFEAIHYDYAVQPFSFYDMEIDNDAFNEMEIVLSPKISKGNETIVELLRDKYNPSSKIIESTLSGLIR